MPEIRVRNVQEAYVRGISLLREQGRSEETRNGPALVHTDPVMTVYERPMERVLLDPVRDANPFFHLMESIWMLAGRNDVESLERYNLNLKKYSDDGETYHGAYGHRWRRHYDQDGELDQLAEVVRLLRANPGDRRVVLSMWDPNTDLGVDGLDFPCNTHIYFRARDFVAGERWLDMMVNCRSNDAIWGAYGANAVHFSVLQEFVAAACGMHVGRFYQNSFNLHAYADALERVGTPSVLSMSYGRGGSPTRLFDSFPDVPIQDALRGLEDLWDGTPQPGGATRIMTPEGLATVLLMRNAYHAFKKRERLNALDLADKIPGGDWRRACTEWLARRYAASDRAI